ncbi:MAG: lamin tail domain-containing protein [Bacteroidota bacterium]
MRLTLLSLFLALAGSILCQGTGEVIITEYYNRPLKPTQEQLDAALPNNPAGADDTPNEGHTEWFEIYNTTDEPVVMDGWTLTDASSSSNVTTIGSFTLAPHTYAVFSGFNIPEAQGGVEFDYFYDYKKPSFNNESSYADDGDTSCPDGVIIEKADGTLVDEVRYDYGYGEYIGNESSGSCMNNAEAIGIPAMGSSSKVSFMLNVDPAVMNAAANDLPENWSFSTIVYDEAGNQRGTPGLANDGSMPPGPNDFGTGEVIITEYHNRPQKPTQEQLDAALPNNPEGADLTPDEGHVEWFEVYNTTNEPVVMDGWTLTDASSSSNVTTIGSFTIEAHSYAVFSGFNIPAAQGGLEFDYFYDYEKPSFNNESSYADDGDTSCPDGVIIQKADGTLVDEVRYDYGYGEYIGNESSGSCMDNEEAIGIPAMGSSSKVSFMLNVDPAVMNSAANDLAENWSFSTIVYDEENNQLGTPGLANDGSLPPEPADPGTGEVIITEYYNRPLKPTQEQLDAALPNNPAGADLTPDEGHVEWFEVYNTTDEPVVMDGWTLTDASSSSNVSTISSFTIEPNSYAVFSGFNIPEAHGGVQFDYFYDYEKPSFNNESSYADDGDTSCPDGVIIQKADGTLVDEVRYDYGYGEYIGNMDSGSCSEAQAAVGIPPMGSSSKVSFMLLVDPEVMNAADNNLPQNWIFSTLVYDEAGNQIGTPGNQNDQIVVSTQDILLAEEVTLYPNPTSTVLNIESGDLELLQLEVYDLAGRQLNLIRPNTTGIDVSQLPSGIYSVKLKFAEGLAMKKFVVQH